MKKIAVFLANGFEEIEALTVVDICRRAKITTSMISIEDTKYVKGTHGIIVEADGLFEDVISGELDMIVLPGGMPGTRNLEAHKGLIDLIQEFDAKRKEISAICAAPSILGHLGMLKGRNACCYPNFEKDLEGAIVQEEGVVQSDYIITARGMGCAIPFSLAIVAKYCGQEKADEIAKGIIYNI